MRVQTRLLRLPRRLIHERSTWKSNSTFFISNIFFRVFNNKLEIPLSLILRREHKNSLVERSILQTEETGGRSTEQESILQELEHRSTRSQTRLGIPRAALHNVAVTVGAIGRVVDDGQRVGLRRERGRAEGDAAVGEHLVAAHGDAGPVRRLGRQLRRLRGCGRARPRGRGRRRGRSRHRGRSHHRRARARAVRAVQAARSPGARHARARVKVTRLCHTGTWLFTLSFRP